MSLEESLMKHLFSPSIIILSVANFILSFFLYANVLEKALFVDLPYFNSIQMVETPIVLPIDYSKSNSTQYGLLGKPTTIRIPRLGLILGLDEPISEEGRWKLSGSKVYLLTLGKSNSGMLGDSLIFTSPSYSLFNVVTNLSEGDRFSVETDKGYLYSYRVNKKIIEDSPYGVGGIGTRGKIIIVGPLKHIVGKGMVITGEYESVEKII